MPKVPVATSAKGLISDHSVACIFTKPNILLLHRLEKARPSGSGIKFRVTLKEWQLATRAVIDTVLVVVVENAAERWLGSVAPQNLKLRGRQELFPFVLGLDDLIFPFRA